MVHKLLIVCNCTFVYMKGVDAHIKVELFPLDEYTVGMGDETAVV